MSRKTEQADNRGAPPPSETLESPEQTKPRFNQVMILNRGEIALRILNACHNIGIGATVGFSKADANSLAVRTALKLGETDSRYGVAFLGDADARRSYKNVPGAIDSSIAYKCDAIHPGYGFTAEDDKAAQAFIDEGIVWIGPSPEAMRKLGDKANARALAQELNIPVIRGTGVFREEETALRAARRLGFPLMAKATNSGGGDGNLVINDEKEFRATFPDLLGKYGEAYLETYIPHAKHVEWQIAADKHGNVASLGERDCTAQRRFQKVEEESPASFIPEITRKKMEQDAIRLVKAANYENLGTIEFIYDVDTGKYYFIEANTRIQVEHPVTEMRIEDIKYSERERQILQRRIVEPALTETTPGMDLIELQLRIALGEPLPTFTLKNNHVMEVRLYTEKPLEDFKADSGTLHHLKTPVGEGIRFDPAYEEGDTVPQEYDRTLGKIVVEGKTREQAIQRMTIALHDFEALGVSTNKEFLLWLISQPQFINGTITTTFIKDAWDDYQKSRLREILPFLADGDFQEQPIPRRLDASKLKQNFVYERRGAQRNYFTEVEEFQRRNPEGCSFRFGTYEEAGIRIALGFWDFSRAGGTMGSEEGSAVAALFELAHKEGLAVLMFTNSGGVKQAEDTVGLMQMDFVVAAKHRFPPTMMYNVYCGNGGGGVNASISERADQKYMLAQSSAGLTGMGILANLLGKRREEMTATVQSESDHSSNRNIDLIVSTPREALERALYEQSILELGNAVRQKGLFIPPPHFDTMDSIAALYKAPAHYRFPALFGDVRHFGHTILDRLRHRREIPVEPQQLTNAEREKILMDPFRPTAAEFLLPEMKVFDKISPFSNLAMVKDSWQYPTIIGAYARRHDRRYLVLGQQPQRRVEADGTLTKFYMPIRPEDYRWATRKVEQAERNNAVDEVLLLGDTTGGASDEKAEAGGIMYEISDFLDVMHRIGIPGNSVLIGPNVSGGGVPFARPLNRAAEFSNAMSSVAAIIVMHYIMTDQWPTEQQRVALLNQLKDGRPEERLKMHFLDEVLPEPPGGIQTDPLGAGRILGSFLDRATRAHRGKSEAQIFMERFERSRRAAQYATVPLRR